MKYDTSLFAVPPAGLFGGPGRGQIRTATITSRQIQFALKSSSEGGT